MFCLALCNILRIAFTTHHITYSKSLKVNSKTECRPSETHLKHSLIVDIVEDSTIDLVGLQSSPVKYRKTELGLYGLLDPDGYRFIPREELFIYFCMFV